MKVGLIDTKLGPFRLPIYELLRKQGIEIILTAKNKEQFLSMPYSFLKPSFFPFFAHGWCPSLWNYLKKNKFDVLISCDVALMHTWLTYLFCRFHGKKFILWNETWQWSECFKAKIVHFWIRHIIRDADALIATGKKSKEFFIKEGVDEQKIFIAPNCAEDLLSKIDSEKVEEIRNKYELNGFKTFLYVCRIIPNKAVDVLVKSFNKMPSDCKLLIVGDYDSDSYWKGSYDYCLKCKFLAEHKGIVFVGKVPYDEIPNYYFACDVFLLTPQFMPKTINPNESWGMVVNEAMSVGKPIIVSNAVGASDDAVTEENGLKVMAGDESSLFDAMLKICKMDLKKMGESSRKLMEEKFTYDKMASGFLNAVRFVKHA